MSIGAIDREVAQGFEPGADVGEEPTKPAETEAPKPVTPPQPKHLPRERLEKEMALEKFNVGTDKGGLLAGSNLDQEYRLATAYSRSGLMPKGLNTPEKVLVALQLCRELKLPPMSSIGKIGVIGQTPFIFGDLPMALVMKSGLLESIVEEWDLADDGSPFEATCIVKRKGLAKEVSRSFSMDDAKRAQLLSNPTWKSYPKRMLQCRARAWALKDTFPDVLGGVAIREWDLDIERPQSIAKEIDAEFLDKPESVSE